MPTVTCPDCDHEQTIDIGPNTYFVVCAACNRQFRVPRAQRVNKRDPKEHASRVNIRVGQRHQDGTLTVAYTVQSAEKANQYLERTTVAADVSDHPQKTYWYVALFKMLQHVGEYKSARIWVKHDQVVAQLAGDLTVPQDDLRTRLLRQIVEQCDEQFLGYEFGRQTRSGGTSGTC